MRAQSPIRRSSHRHLVVAPSVILGPTRSGSGWQERVMKLASRMQRLGTETAFEVLVRARALEAQGRDVIHLEIGEPDFDTPSNVSEAGANAIREGWTHYGPASGQPDLRQVIADYMNART